MKCEQFGALPGGEEIFRYTLQNANGITVDIITYGAAVQRLLVPDKRGNFADILLGYDTLEGYLHDSSYQGVIVGRYGNRIQKGTFSLDGKTYRLTINDGENHLHGGKNGFHKKVWKVVTTSDSPVPSVILEIQSPAGEEGYPGTVTLRVEYRLTEANELVIQYTGTTDAVTILNPTFHGYFNLSGDHSRQILDHELMIHADAYTPTGKGLIPTGEIKEVKNTPLDFLTLRNIGERIENSFEPLLIAGGYDHNWVLNDYSKEVRKAALLVHPETGRAMEVFTDQPGIQFYSGNFLTPAAKGTKKGVYGRRTGLCLEAQAFPDSPNKPHFPSVTLKPGEVYTQTTIYKFTT